MADRRLRVPRKARDPLGLRRALPPRLLPLLVGAMALLAALGAAGEKGAAALAARWQAGAAAVTLTLPDGIDAPHTAEALRQLRARPEVAEANLMAPERLAELLRPWLGAHSALSLPGVVELRLSSLPDNPDSFAEELEALVPGAEVEAHGVWVSRLVALARSVQAMAFLVLVLVVGVAAAVVTVATRAGLAARREAIALLHDLGATRGDIAGRFARRAGLLAGVGALLGSILALPALWMLTGMAMPASAVQIRLAALPVAALIGQPFAAALIGWVTAQVTVRAWLRRLP
ncbi:cell division protein FtsX [Acetobacteraceae bacterium H6797]|nr:cell division protein FtsX [Acetobacteraceae bacterium H6797]